MYGPHEPFFCTLILTIRLRRETISVVILLKFFKRNVCHRCNMVSTLSSPCRA